MGSPPMNFFEGTLVRLNGSVVFQSGNENKLTVPVSAASAPKLQERIGQSITLGLRPEDIGQSDGSQVQVVVERIEATGVENFVYCSGQGTSLVMRVPATPTVRKGDAVALRFDMEKSHFFDSATGQALLSFSK
jgi:multiple sugar transport system ATP-binding protein